MPDVRQTLIDARALLSERGLAKGDLEDDEGRLCLRGAINLAAWGTSMQHDCWWTGRYAKLLLACELAMGFSAEGGDWPTDAADWNNLPETTLEDVLAKFDEGIFELIPA